MKWVAAESSLLKSAAYESEEVLWLRFHNGRTYKYWEVPRSVRGIAGPGIERAVFPVRNQGRLPIRAGLTARGITAPTLSEPRPLVSRPN